MSSHILRIIMRRFYENHRQGVIIAAIALVILPPVLLVVFIAAIISLPEEALRQFVLSLLPPQELIYVYDVRPDLLLGDPTQLEGYDFGLPINRTIQSHFGDMGSFTGEAIDYITYNCNGDNIYAIGDGVVQSVEPDIYGGYTVIIEHEAPDDDPDNFYIYSKYWSLSECDVEVNQDVEIGEIIGAAQSTGNAQNTLIFCFGMWGDSSDDMVDPVTYIGEKEFDESVEIVFRDG